ncbi:MAG: Asd/ArgC dimerization domain-containing protein [Acidobacteriota bacterium]
MTRIALIHPTGLLATDVREALERRPELAHELRLLSDDTDEIGTLTQVDGAAAMVGDLGETSLEEVDLVLLFGSAERYRPLLETLPAGVDALIVAAGGRHDGVPIVDGVNLEAVRRGDLLLSPPPATIGLAHLLQPLLEFGLREVVATVLEPVSTYGKEGLDELFEQTRDLLSFRGEVRREVLPAQLAFNVLGPSADGVPQLREHLGQLLGVEFAVSAQLLRVGLFHGLGLSVAVRLDNDPGLATVREALEAPPLLGIVEESDLLGTVDAAGRREVLIGAVEPAGDGVYQLWAVLDNLGRGGALNAVAVLEVLTGHADG